MGIFDAFSKKTPKGVALVKKPQNTGYEEKEDPYVRAQEYQWFLDAYEQVPLVNSIIETQTNQVVQEFFFEGPNKVKLEKWADDINLMQFFHQTTKNMLIFGNAYVEVIKKGGKIAGLKILNPIWIDVYRSPLGQVIGYSQIIDNEKLILWGTTGKTDKDRGFKKRVAKFDNLVHFKYNVVGSNKYGKSVIAPLKGSIVQKAQMENQLGALLKKYIAPLIHATVGNNEMPATAEAVSSVASELRDLHAESEIVTTHLVSLDVLQFENKGMDIQTPLTHIEQQIVTGGQVPPVLLGRSDNASEKAAEVQLRNFGRHIKAVQREVKIEFEDKIVVGQGMGSPKDKLVWTQAEEREWEIHTDTLRGLVTDGIITAQKANDLLPPKYSEKLPEMDPLNKQMALAGGQQVPRANQMKTDKVKDNPTDPTKTTKHPNAVGRVDKNDRSPTK